MQYAELDAIFWENGDWNSCQDNWTAGAKKFERFGGTEEGDDNAELLNSWKKPYRYLLYANQITEFDFRHYLFARQTKVSSIY